MKKVLTSKVLAFCLSRTHLAEQKLSSAIDLIERVNILKHGEKVESLQVDSLQYESGKIGDYYMGLLKFEHDLCSSEAKIEYVLAESYLRQSKDSFAEDDYRKGNFRDKIVKFLNRLSEYAGTAINVLHTSYGIAYKTNKNSYDNRQDCHLFASDPSQVKMNVDSLYK